MKLANHKWHSKFRKIQARMTIDHAQSKALLLISRFAMHVLSPSPSEMVFLRTFPVQTCFELRLLGARSSNQNTTTLPYAVVFSKNCSRDRRYLLLTRRNSRKSWWFVNTGDDGNGGPNAGTLNSEYTMILEKKSGIMVNWTNYSSHFIFISSTGVK